MQFMNAVVYTVLVATAFAHSGHNDHADQMPLDYVKYPYQAVYPGDNEGKLTPVTSRSKQVFNALSADSDCRFYFFWHHNLCQTSLASVPDQGQRRLV
jgi:hypothetical protein